MTAKETTKNKTAEAVEAYGYCRVSGKDQENGHGFERQEEAIRNFAAFKNFRIANLIRDTVTGANEWADREGFNQMVQAMRSNGVKTVIVEHQDRLARELLVQELIIRDFRREGFTIWSTEGGELTAEDNDEMRQFRGIMAQSDKKRLVKKLRIAREHMRKTEGRCEGRKAYGSTAAEQEIIARMKELRRAGMNNSRIADTFNNEGVTTRTAGRRWYNTTVSRILKANDGRRKLNKTAAARSNVA